MENTNHNKNITPSMKIVYGDVTLGLHGEDFSYLFSYSKGGPESIRIDGKEWLYRTPLPTFWRATTDNDRGNGFSRRSCMWAGADLFISCKQIKVCIDGADVGLPNAPENNKMNGKQTADKVQINFTYATATTPATDVDVLYEIDSTGTIDIHVHYHGHSQLPQLPVFGLRFIMPTAAYGYKYEGLSGETYPDRMAGAAPGIYEVEGLPVTKYLVPQDCNVHMKTKWLEVYRNSTLNNAEKSNTRFGLKFFSKEKEFAVSCLPYTAMELENATHQEELPPVRRTVVCVLGSVRGVGGIDSWGADVEPAYQIDAGNDIRYSFSIKKADL